jgi:hypothetical protein
VSIQPSSCSATIDRDVANEEGPSALPSTRS